ncbi:NADP-dependent oxidoreductase domain-containing protein [Podospora australis]|uniref:NADP-dependent oxidoreductase domain-containing protein n=1 Tax=Podospora australis TaxID=1536484 RepID=A0AAN6WSA1_9PEZI|nr:NADP-dependent oxidoreductase domain-containing protein [Podospora australis]
MATPSEQTAPMPPMLYGTAWKKERTADLVYEAIKAGFRGIDTAAMKKHYNEAGTGEGISRAIAEGIVSRKDLWIQTKFTPGDEAFSPQDSIPSQISASVHASLSNLSTPYIDALVLHSPFPSLQDTLKAFAALNPFIESRQILSVGISNTPFPILEALHSSLVSHPQLQPKIVQNRFRAGEYNWDLQTRNFCKERYIKYQGFWTLTGNPGVWQTREFVGRIAEGAVVGRAEAWYSLMLEEGITVLNGTTSQEHMKGDLEGVERVREWRGTKEGGEVWEGCFESFKKLVG